MQSDKQLPATLWSIVAVALVLRLLGAWCANLTFDERANLALAETIDFRPGHFHLVSRTVAHPLLSIYLMKLSGLLFGTGNLGLRMLHLLAGTATVVPVYFLGKRVFSEKAGLWAAALLAVDQFHVSWSRVVLHEGLLLFFSALALLQLLRVLKTGSTRGFVLLGVLLGLAYLAKESAILLLPVLWIYLLITPQHRHVLRLSSSSYNSIGRTDWQSVLQRPAWYLAHGVFLVVIAPDVVWNLAQAREGYLYRDIVFAMEPWRVSLKSFSLYLGELFRTLIGADVLDVEYEQGNLFACHWPAGLLYLGATLAAVGRHKDAAVRLLLVAFFLVFFAFIFLPGGGRFEPFWWASISLIPAVVFAGWALDRASSGDRLRTVVALLLLGYLGILSAAAAWRPGLYEPRATVEDFVTDFTREADAAVQRGELREAEDRFIFVLNIGGPRPEAYYGLGLVAWRRDQPDKAERLLLKCLELDPDHQAAKQLLREIR